MTGSVKELTERANVRPPEAASGPPVPAVHLRAFADALERLGYEVAPLLAATGVDRSELADPDLMVPCWATEALFRRAREIRPMRNLALRLAEVMPFGTYPLLDYLIVTSGSVAEGQRRLSRYFRLLSIPIEIHVREDEDPIRVEVSSPGNPFGIEYSIALNVLHLRSETGGRIRIESVCLMHEPEDAAEFERFVGCPLRRQASWNGVAIPRTSWSLPMRNRDSILQGLLERQAEEMLARLPDSRGAAEQTRRALTARVAGGDTRVETVARQLATSPRTLQRRLAAEGTSYQELLEKVRREAAEGYLADSTLTVGEVGYLLGYSEPAAFHRAFKRWHAVTPLEFRRRGIGVR